MEGNDIDDLLAPIKRNPRAGLFLSTPQERGNEKFHMVIRWLYEWHVTSGAVVQSLLGTSQRDYMSRLEKRGYVQSVAAPGLPIGRVWMLTADGVAAAIPCCSTIHAYDMSPSSIDYKTLRHDLAVQGVVVEFMRKIRMQGVHQGVRAVPERLLGADKLGKKRPDALVVVRRSIDEFSFDETHAIEVELTPKKGRELDEALYAAAQLIENESACAVEYFSHSKALLENYRAVLSRPLNVWAKNAKAKRWEVASRWHAPPHVVDGFEWHFDSSLLKGLSPY
jgi:hypothetical protein